METGAVAGVANIANHLPRRDGFARRNSSGSHVGIPRRQARAVVQQNLVAVAVVPARDNDRAAVGGENRRPLRRGNVRTAMPGITVSVVVTKIAGNI